MCVCSLLFVLSLFSQMYYSVYQHVSIILMAAGWKWTDCKWPKWNWSLTSIHWVLSCTINSLSQCTSTTSTITNTCTANRMCEQENMFTVDHSFAHICANMQDAFGLRPIWCVKKREVVLHFHKCVYKVSVILKWQQLAPMDNAGLLFYLSVWDRCVHLVHCK